MKPTWTSSSFLQYLGMLVGVISLFVLLGVVGEDNGRWWFLLATSVALAIVGAIAEALRRRGEPLAAGLVSYVAVSVFAAVVATILDLIGLLPDDGSESERFFQKGFAFGVWLLLLVVLVAAIYARGRFAFPLHTLTIGSIVWYWIMDVLEGILGGGDTVTAILAILVGFGFVATAAAVDTPAHEPRAFWHHLIGGLSVGGGVLWFWHEHTWEWLLVMAIALGYIALARRLERSSYAVLGAIGLAAATTYFVEKWFTFGSLIPFFPVEPDENADWGRPLVYLGLGAVYMLLGWLVARGGRERETAT